MQVLVLSPKDYGRNSELLAQMHRLRYRVFKERLDWSVSVTGDMEIDAFDALGPDYLLVMDDRGEVVGSVRLLPTTGPNMLADTFPELLDGAPAPCSASLAESSRFCVDTQRTDDLNGTGLRRATFLLFAAMIEWGLTHSPKGIATVTDTRMERVLRRAGWPLRRLGPPRQIGITTAVAGELEVSEAALARVRHGGDLNPLGLERAALKMAA